jgi:hypothetical protein
MWTRDSSPAWLTGFRNAFLCRPSAAPVGKGRVRGGIEIDLSRSDRQRLHEIWRPGCRPGITYVLRTASEYLQ